MAIGRLRIGSLKKGELVYLNDAAVEKIFQNDDPEELKMKKSLKTRSAAHKKKTIKKVSKRAVAARQAAAESRKSK